MTAGGQAVYAVGKVDRISYQVVEIPGTGGGTAVVLPCLTAIIGGGGVRCITAPWVRDSQSDRGSLRPPSHPMPIGREPRVISYLPPTGGTLIFHLPLTAARPATSLHL